MPEFARNYMKVDFKLDPYHHLTKMTINHKILGPKQNDWP